MTFDIIIWGGYGSILVAGFAFAARFIDDADKTLAQEIADFGVFLRSRARRIRDWALNLRGRRGRHSAVTEAAL